MKAQETDKDTIQRLIEYRKTNFVPNNEIIWDLKRILTDLFAPGRWIQVSDDLLLITNHAEAHYLSYLFNQLRIKLSKDEKAEWFLAPTKEAFQKIRISPRQQTNFMTKFKKRGYVQTQTKGLPPKRWIRLVLVEIYLDIMEARKQRSIPEEFSGTRLQDFSSSTIDSIKELNTKEYPPSTEERVHDGKSPMFFPEKVKPSKFSKFDQSCAEQLKSILIRKGTIHKYNKSKWSNSFRILRTKDNKSYQEIQSLLDWYENKGKQLLKPSISNAEHFRQRIRDNWLPRLMAEDTSSIEISPEAKEISITLSSLRWPKGSVKDVPVCIQIIINNFTSFRSKLQTFVTTHPEKIYLSKSRFKDAPGHILLAHRLINKWSLPSTRSFIEEWMRAVQNSIVNWKEWFGNLIGMAWDGNPFNKRFNKISRTWAQDSESNWNNLMKEMV